MFWDISLSQGPFLHVPFTVPPFTITYSTPTHTTTQVFFAPPMPLPHVPTPLPHDLPHAPTPRPALVPPRHSPTPHKPPHRFPRPCPPPLFHIGSGKHFWADFFVALCKNMHCFPTYRKVNRSPLKLILWVYQKTRTYISLKLFENFNYSKYFRRYGVILHVRSLETPCT